VEIYNAAVENPQHEALTELSWQGRNSKIDVASGNLFLNAAILGQPSFCDVHVCHHFHARDHGQSKMTRRRRHFVERAVNAIANFEFIFEWLEMNIARSVLDRLIKDQIDKANDGSCV